MPQTAIFLPVLGLIGWTLLVLLIIPYRRFRAAANGQVCAEDYRYGERESVPPTIRLANRAFMNLLEVPVLFYALALILYVSGNVDPPAVVLAWVYLGLRIVHSLIFLTYNHIFHRFLAFAGSNCVVLALWLRTLPLFVS